jgi:hypothetical protein
MSEIDVHLCLDVSDAFGLIRDYEMKYGILGLYSVGSSNGCRVTAIGQNNL